MMLHENGKNVCTVPAELTVGWTIQDGLLFLLH